MALGHISAIWNDLDRAGSAGFQPARGTKSPLRREASMRGLRPRAGWKPALPALSEGAGDRLRHAKSMRQPAATDVAIGVADSTEPWYSSCHKVVLS